MENNTAAMASLNDYEMEKIVPDMGGKVDDSAWLERYSALEVERGRLIERILLDAEITDKLNKRIVQITAALLDHTAKLTEEITLVHEFKAQLKEQQAEVEQLQICNVQLAKQFAEAQEEITINQCKIEQLQNDLTQLKYSTSHRVTRFLRAIKGVISRKHYK